MRKVNVNLPPKGGYVFIEADGTHIRGNNWATTMARVVEYRQQNKLPAGDPRTEVMEQACQRNPNLCYEDNGAPVSVTPTKTLKGRILRWLAEKRIRFSSKKHPHVSKDEVVTRARVCAGCPNNSSIPAGCSSCLMAMKESRKQLLGPRYSTRIKNLGGCSILGEDLQTSTTLDLVREHIPELPGHCWRKATL